MRSWIFWRSRRKPANVRSAPEGAAMPRQLLFRPFVPCAILAVAALLAAAGDGAAQPVEQFFARKTVTVTIGYTAGGSYDLYGRMVARHLGKHIPGQPSVIAQNMPGAGSLKAANYLYEVAPKDGTALGVIVES